MKLKLIKHGILTTTALALLLQTGMPGITAPQQVKAAASYNIVRLNAFSTMAVRDAQMMMQDKGLVLSFTVTVTNNGNTQLDLMDYWLRIRGNGGKIFKATITEEDKAIKYVSAKTSVNLNYFAVVDSQTKLAELNFDIVKFDFSVAGYERKLGTIKNTAGNGKVPTFQPKVILFNETKIKSALKQAYVTKDQNSLYLTISFLLENVGYSSSNLGNLGFAIQTDSYSVYDVNTSSIGQAVLQPNERKVITMQAKLPTALAGKEVTLVAYTKDETNKVKLSNGAFALPVLHAATPAEAGKSRVTYMEGQQINTYTGNAVLSENNGETEISLDYVLENLGNTAVKQPDLEYSINTSSNISYPLNYTKVENSMLLPNLKKTITLTGTVPASINKTAAQLIVRTTATETSASYVVGIYNVLAATQQGAVGGSFIYKNDYAIKLSSIHRSPMENSDVLVAELAVSNRSALSKKTLTLSGYFMINGVKVEGESTTLSLDKAINIAPSGTYNMIVFMKIPYNTTVDNISFVLTEPETDKVSKKVFQFSGQSISPILPYSSITNYKIDNVGSRSSVRVLKTNIFQGEAANYFYTEFEAINLETRSSDLAHLGGYLLDANGQMASIQVSEVKEKVMPNGKVLLSAWGKINKSFKTDNYQLIFGQSVSNKPVGGQNDAAVEAIIVKPVYVQVLNKPLEMKKDFKDLQLSAYKLSLKNIQTSLDVQGQFTVNGVKLNMEYDLIVDSSYDYIAGDHQIMFEFIDQDPAKATYTKTLPLLKTDEANPIALKAVKNTPIEIVFNDTEIQSKVSSYNTYKLNVYHVYGGAKLLLASRDLKWFAKQ